MGTVQQQVAAELSALLIARRAVNVAEKLQAERPEDRAVLARTEQARERAKEAATLLKAALAAGGLTYAELQAELRQSSASA